MLNPHYQHQIEKPHSVIPLKRVSLLYVPKNGGDIRPTNDEKLIIKLEPALLIAGKTACITLKAPK